MIPLVSMDNKFIIGRTFGTHGLKGSLKMRMHYPYSDEILLNSVVFINNKKLEVENVFGRVKENCIVKFKEFLSIEDASKYKNEEVEAKIGEELFYSIHLIGYTLFRDNCEIGPILNVEWVNGIEFLDLKDEMVTIDQIKSIENNCVYI